MPLTVTEVDELQQYISGVMERAGHHAGNVDEVALALVGAILWRKDDDADIKVMAQNSPHYDVMRVSLYVCSLSYRRGHAPLCQHIRRERRVNWVLLC